MQYLLWVQRVQRYQRVLSLHYLPTTRWRHQHQIFVSEISKLFFCFCVILETVTYSGTGQTLHTGESSVSLVASISSITSLSSVSLGTSRALNRDNRRSRCHLRLCIISKMMPISVNDAYCVEMNVQQVHGHQRGQKDQQDQRHPGGKRERLGKLSSHSGSKCTISHLFQWCQVKLTDSPRSPLLPEGPKAPGAPGEPGAPGAPALPDSPRSPYRGSKPPVTQC